MTNPSAPSKPGVQWTAWAVVALCAVLSAINLQLWGFDVAPLIDWPNHFARHSLQCQGDPDAGLGRYFVYDLKLVPNLSSELVHTLQIACRSLVVTQKVLIQFATLGVMLSTIVLHAAIWRRWSLWPALSGLVMYHMAFAYGFENFVIAIPPTLLALALWFVIESRPFWLRTLLMIPVAGVIYILHLYAFAFLGAALGLLEAARWYRAWQAGAPMLRSGLAVIAGLVLIAALPMLHVISVMNTTNGVNPSTIDFGPWLMRVSVLLSPFSPYSTWYFSIQTRIVALLTALVFLLLPSLLRLLGARPRMDKRCVVPGLLLCVISFLVPWQFGGVYFTEIRFPVLTACFLIAASDCKFSPRLGTVFAVFLVGFFAARMVLIQNNWRVYEAEVAQIRALGSVLENDDRVFVAKSSLDPRLVLHTHTAAYLAADVGVFIPTLFTGGNSLTARPEFVAHDRPHGVPTYWTDLLTTEGLRAAGEPAKDPPNPQEWREFYTHVLLLKPSDAQPVNASDFGRLIAQDDIFQLYEMSPKP